MAAGDNDKFLEEWFDYDSIFNDIKEAGERYNSQKPNLNVSLESVVSLRSAMLIAAKSGNDSRIEDEPIPHKYSKHSENEFKIPNIQTLKKKSHTTIQNVNSSICSKAKRSRSLNETMNGNQLLFQSASALKKKSHTTIQNVNSSICSKAKRSRNLNETMNGNQLLFQSASNLLENDKIIKDNILAMEKDLLGESLTEKRKNHDISILDKHNTTLMFELNSILGNNLKNAVEKDISRLEETIHSIPEYIQSPEKGNTSRTNESSYNLNWTNESFAKTIKENNIFLNKSLRTNEISSQSFNRAFENLPSTSTLNGFKNIGPFYGLPLKVKELLASARGIDELDDWQDEFLNLPALKQRKNLIYALPKSCGKTLMAEILLFQEIACRNKNVLFILPYVSIIQEQIWALAPFQIALDFIVEEYAGIKGKYPPRQRRKKRCVYVATIEKASNLIYSLYENGRINELGLIIVDEIHLLGEARRGCILETLLSTVLYLKENIQIIGMSGATIGNINDLCTFLKAEVYTRNFPPTELTEYIKCENNIYKIDYNAEKMAQLSRKMENSSDISNHRDPDHIGMLVEEIIYETSCLIFCPTKKNCENVAILLTTVLKKDVLDFRKMDRYQLCSIMQNNGRLCPILEKTLPYGIAYHHSGLTSEERVLIEDAFRNGVINVICCTLTLAAGAKFSVQRVILRSPYVGAEFITLSKYKQMIGRASACFGEMGESYLICARKDIKTLKKLLDSSTDYPISTLHENNNMGLKNFLLSVIGHRITKTRQEINELMKYSLLSVQKDKLKLNIGQIVDDSIKSLFEQTVVYVNHDLANKPSKIIIGDEELHVTRQGIAAIKSGLQITKAEMIYTDLVKAQKRLVLLNSLHLLYLVTPYDLAEKIIPERDIYYNAYKSLEENEVIAAKVIGISVYTATRIAQGNPLRDLPERVYKRFYLTLMLLELWKAVPIFLIAEKFKVNPGFLQQLMTSSANFASNLYHFCENLDEFHCFCALLEDLSNRLVHCCTPELLPLLELPHVKKSRGKQLLQAGFKNLQTVASTQPLTLVKAIPDLSTEVAIQMINRAKLILLEKVENLREDAQDLLEWNVKKPISYHV